MRPALLIIGAFALLLVAATGAAGGKAPRAVAQAAVSGTTTFGEVRRNRPGEGDVDTAVDGEGVTIRRAIAKASVAEDGTGRAAARVFDVDVLDGLVTARSARRDSDGGGAISELRIEGRLVGDVRRKRTFPVTGGTVIVNTGSTALRVRTDTADVRIAVAKATARAFPTPEPTASPKPSPSPEPTKTARPDPTATATKTPKRKKAPNVTARLTKGGYAFPVFGKVRFDDTFGAARAAPIGAHQGADIFAPFGAPVIAVQDGRLIKVGTLPISGNRLWLVTDNGDAFFYAHMSAFARTARNGASVKAGDVVGFIGNTGDAEPTPPHTHFEVHPGGMNEPAVDPYPIVTAWRDRDDVPSGAWLQQLGADATERPGALVTVRDFIAE